MQVLRLSRAEQPNSLCAATSRHEVDDGFGHP